MRHRRSGIDRRETNGSECHVSPTPSWTRFILKSSLAEASAPLTLKVTGADARLFRNSAIDMFGRTRNS
jgi:hypothetical protein